MVHASPALFTALHKRHHSHKLLHSLWANALTLAERVFIVLTANESAKVVGMHPLTRVS